MGLPLVVSPLPPAGEGTQSAYLFRTDFLDGSSVRYGSTAVEDYAEASAAIRGTYGGASHPQAGDPAKLGTAIVGLASVAQPPLRYAAGSDAVAGISGKLLGVQNELDAWHALSVSTDGQFA